MLAVLLGSHRAGSLLYGHGEGYGGILVPDGDLQADFLPAFLPEPVLEVPVDCRYCDTPDHEQGECGEVGIQAKRDHVLSFHSRGGRASMRWAHNPE